MQRWEQCQVNFTGNAMAPRMLRLGLSFIVGLGCWFGRVEAQTPAGPETAQAPSAAPAAPVAPMSSRPDGALRDHFNRHGYLCGQHLDWYGCGGWRAQTTFAFGSCRTFFGEPCLPQQPRQGGNAPGGCNR